MQTTPAAINNSATPPALQQRIHTELTLEQFRAACIAQSDNSLGLVLKCPACGTLQTAREFIAAGVGKDFHAVEMRLGFSCIGRFTGAPSPRKEHDGKPCNWTLGGFFQIHRLTVTTPDGVRHPHFELASLEEANKHRARLAAATQPEGGAA